MAKPLDPKIGAILKEYGFGKDAVWDCHGTWVVYHRVLEQIAVGAGIELDPPQIVEADGANGIATVCVTGRMGEKSIWSIGEAAPKNNKNAYPWAMAEKRAVDRVILKLIGLHGLAYSEEEADDFKDSKPAPLPSGEFTQTAAKRAMMELSRLLHDDESTPDVETLEAHLLDHKELIEQVMRDWPAWWYGQEGVGDGTGAEDKIKKRRDELRQREAEGMSPETRRPEEMPERMSPDEIPLYRAGVGTHDD